VINNHHYLAAFAPLFGDYEEFVGLLFIGASEAPYRETARRSQIYIVILGLVGSVLATIFGTLLSKTITDPLRQLVQQATMIASGDLEQRLSIKSGDELEQLANAFNSMSESLQIMKVRDQNANPLTKLPGNLMIEDEIGGRLRMGAPLAVLYTDLDHFKSFNDKFGFEQGDQVITLTADSIRQAVAEAGEKEDFVGHIGGDDFIVVTVPERAETLCQEIIRIFDARIPSLYPEEDRARGYIESTDRRGQQMRFPLCSISIAIVTNEQRKINDFLELSSLAAEVKKFAKSLDGSSFARDRRTDRTAPLPNLEEKRS
ncbi:MAG: HAMP domain-containing protein, partial [Bacteroidota bacterium]